MKVSGVTGCLHNPQYTVNYKGGVSNVAVENPAVYHFNQVIGVDIISSGAYS